MKLLATLLAIVIFACDNQVVSSKKLEEKSARHTKLPTFLHMARLKPFEEIFQAESAALEEAIEASVSDSVDQVFDIVNQFSFSNFPSLRQWTDRTFILMAHTFRWFLSLFKVEGMSIKEFLRGYRVSLTYDLAFNIVRWLFFAQLAYIYV